MQHITALCGIKSSVEIEVSLLRLLKRYNLRRPIETVKVSPLKFFPSISLDQINGPPRHGHWERFIEVFPNWSPQTRLNSVSTLGKRWPQVAREAGAVRHRRTKRSTPPVCVHQSIRASWSRVHVFLEALFGPGSTDLAGDHVLLMGAVDEAACGPR